MVKQIIVLGIYRSGTSLISGILDKLGIDMGDHKNLADYYNPRGYYECEESIKVTSWLRDRCGKVFYNVDKSDLSKVIDDNEANNRVREYIKSRGENDWGVKDPKMLAFFGLYQKYLENPYVIFIRRNRESIIASWKSMKDREDPTSIENAHDNHLEMLINIKDTLRTPYLEIDYSEHIDNPKETAQKIADFVGVPNNQQADNFASGYSLSGKK